MIFSFQPVFDAFYAIDVATRDIHHLCTNAEPRSDSPQCLRWWQQDYEPEGDGSFSPESSADSGSSDNLDSGVDSSVDSDESDNLGGA